MRSCILSFVYTKYMKELRLLCYKHRITDTIQERSNSDFDVKSASIQFYGNSHNFQSDCWIGLKVYMGSSDMFFYVGFEF
jgi:hypothetical protein